jgi:hypothetical protein
MFIAMSAYIKNTERSQLNNLMLHLNLLEKQEQANPKTSRRRKKVKIRAKQQNRYQKNPKSYKESTKQKDSSFKR